MSDSDDPFGRLLDQLIATDFTLRAFMLEVSIELAKGKPNPMTWAQQFVSNMQARVDANESFVGELARELPSHELARGNLDGLGRDLLRVLSAPRA